MTLDGAKVLSRVISFFYRVYVAAMIDSGLFL